MRMVFQCDPVVRNGNKEITDALIKAIKDEASKRGLVRDELIDFCNRFMREGEIKACIEHLLDNFKRYFWRYY
mgnify:FL=1|jgi:hypothetical protein|nr:MAG TPA_asm: replication protein A [Caudoviricetes sp.]